ncbi:L-asparaginase 1 [Fusarium albosuccineum]|uniref:asparaginase n=1 Tax=Fusarium albosuccineum TaxID=1237068 RepID=A0A8H4PHN8_9HYPO|nr:L-asparaginase 1 [Fusarium albosuccineum]
MSHQPHTLVLWSNLEQSIRNGTIDWDVIVRLIPVAHFHKHRELDEHFDTGVVVEVRMSKVECESKDLTYIAIYPRVRDILLDFFDKNDVNKNRVNVNRESLIYDEDEYEEEHQEEHDPSHNEGSHDDEMPLIPPLRTNLMTNRKKILVINMGGTIGATRNDGIYKSGTLPLDILLKGVPYDEKNISLEPIERCRGDSMDITRTGLLEHVQFIREQVDKRSPWGVVILFGTDQAVELGVALGMTFGSSKPLSVAIATAARAATDAGADGPENIRAAIATAAHEKAREYGCLIADSKHLHCPLTAIKYNVSSIHPWASSKGPVGKFDEESAPDRLTFRFPVVMDPIPAVKGLTAESKVPEVYIAISHSEFTSLFEDKSMDGLVIAGFSDGFLPENDKVLNKLEERGVIIVVSHRGFEGSVKQLTKGRGIPAGNIYPHPARQLLILCLMARMSKGQIEECFAKHGGLGA